MTEISNGDKVAIHYTGRLDNGEVFDTSEGRDPLVFEAGGQEIIPGLSQGVIGLETGAEKTFTIEPEEAYGQRQEGLEQEVPRDILPDQAKIGDALQAETENGTIVVWVKELDDDKAIVDANHPLAGKTLTFDVQVVSVDQS